MNAADEVSYSAFREVAAVMAKAPDADADAPAPDRANWLWMLATALDDLGLGEQAEKARDEAVQLVSTLIDIVAGGELA